MNEINGWTEKENFGTMDQGFRLFRLHCTLIIKCLIAKALGSYAIRLYMISCSFCVFHLKVSPLSMRQREECTETWENTSSVLAHVIDESGEWIEFFVNTIKIKIHIHIIEVEILIFRFQ